MQWGLRHCRAVGAAKCSPEGLKKGRDTQRAHTCAKVMLTWQIVAQHGQ